MSSDINSTNANIAQVPISPSIRLIILLIFNIPSFICTLFILFHLLKNRILRNSLQNHVIIALLISILPTHTIDVPFYVVYLSLGHVWPANTKFCRFWSFVSVGIYDTIGILMAYSAVERHILVFYDYWLLTKRRKILFHYFPLFFTIMYSLIFYIYAILFPPCEDHFDYTQPWCSYPCYYDENILSTYDTIVNAILPTFIVLIFSIILVVRFILQKRRFVTMNSWRKYRRLIIQTVNVSSLRIIFNLPGNLLILAHWWGLSADAGATFAQYTYFFTYFTPFLLPFVCLSSLPEIYKKLTKILVTPYTATVVPIR